VVNVADGARKQILTLEAEEEKNPRIAMLTWAPDGASLCHRTLKTSHDRTFENLPGGRDGEYCVTVAWRASAGR
jgi:hypothetical protein